MGSDLTVFGATGGTGRELVAQALHAGHRVRAVVRRSAALELEHARLTVIEGDFLTKDSLVIDAIAGADGVLSALGARSGRAPSDVCVRGTHRICDAMRGARVRRLIVVSAIPVGPDGEKSFFDRALLHPLLHVFFCGAYEDLGRMEKDLARTTDIDWTIVRPPRLVDGPATGTWRAATSARLPGARQIRRADLAAAMLAYVGNPTSIHASINIAY